MSLDHLSNVPLIELFRAEVSAQSQVLTTSLLALERDPAQASELDQCMRAAHSLKGAASVVGLQSAIRVAHRLEDCFVAAQRGPLRLRPDDIDRLLRAVDVLGLMASGTDDDPADWDTARSDEVAACLATLDEILNRRSDERSTAGNGEASRIAPPAAPRPNAADSSDRVLRVTAENLNRLLGLAGEARVESRWIAPFGASLLRVKRLHQETCAALEQLRTALAVQDVDAPVQAALARAHRSAAECQQTLTARLAELEMFDRRALNLSHRLYDEALAVRMRPFADGVTGLPRLVRDAAHSLGKQVRLEIAGEATQVDREILARLDAPLGHLLRNAVDHGIEPAAARVAAGKPAEGTIRVEARHQAGALQITVSDDGRGVDVERIRTVVVERQLLSASAASALSDTELLDFLFLPGFTMKPAVTEVSGRGVGLDAVQEMVRQVRGNVRIASQPERGTRFILQLPVTLSIVRTLLADISGEPYAFPLAAIVRTMVVSRRRLASIEGRQHVEVDGHAVGIIRAHEVLELPEIASDGDDISLIVLGDPPTRYGLVVDRFLGERELVVQPLDPKLGKIKDIAAGALMEDGSPVLIVDTDDLMRSMDRLIAGARPSRIAPASSAAAGRSPRRILVVDDSLTVRELERKLLTQHGYDVDVAIDGMDGWNAIRSSRYDLVITDIDMPRMDGIELVSRITSDPSLKGIPAVVVSYKDRDGDRQRGLEVGASRYLTKGSFHDDTFMEAVVDLIGPADA